MLLKTIPFYGKFNELLPWEGILFWSNNHVQIGSVLDEIYRILEGYIFCCRIDFTELRKLAQINGSGYTIDVYLIVLIWKNNVILLFGAERIGEDRRGVMKGILGAILIYLTYISVGVFMFNTWPFNHGIEGSVPAFFIVTHLALALLLYLSSRIINRYKGILGFLFFVAWYLSSTVYGISQVKKLFDEFNPEDLDGWNIIRHWDFLLWEWSVPIYIGTAQIIFIICHFLFSIIKKEWDSNRKLN
ncbi:hypothetical protein H7C19_05295 [Cohnella nanjingensis]|uniref:Uncharacterized protein n=1 Tax=Cohnella nanjingensis TaxID=1387779 RepID=A0A7X0RMA9_9BACL|nr:hypothetical protein [Cohnella nanjingensis]